MQIGPTRPVTPASRPTSRVIQAAPAARKPAPAQAIRAQGAPDTASKVGGTLLGTAAGVGGAYSLWALLTIGSGAVPLLGWAAMGAMVLTGAGLGFLGGDRLGDKLEGKQATGKPHKLAQLGGGALGGVLGLAGGFWLGAFTLGSLAGTPLVGLATGALAAGLGALGGAEGARRLVDYLAAH